MFHLKHNVPAPERLLRVGAGLALAAAAAFGPWLPAGPWPWVVAGGGLMFALTGVVGFCPACAMLGRRL